MEKLKIVVAHPGRQHSFRLATALTQEKYLFKYITTIYNKNNSFLMRFTKLFLNEDNFKRASNRKCEALKDDDIIQFCQIRGLLLLLLLRIDRKGDVVSFLNNNIINSFGKKVAKYAIKHKVDAVIMYDTTAPNCFKILEKRAPHIKRILDVSIANRRHTKDFIENNLSENDIQKYQTELPVLWDKKVLSNSDNEISSSHFFLVASEFVEKSLLYANVNKNQIKKVPYGVDLNKFIFAPNVYEDKKVINFLFVGQINMRKGINYLLEAFKTIDNTTVTINLVGNYNPKSELYQSYKDYGNINFMGLKQHDELAKIYKDADVFVLPSLSEGMALVGLEALSCGIPLICTDHSGINDLIQDGYNGFVIPAANTQAIKEKIQWFINNKSKIKEMKNNAAESVENYTWDTYEKNITNAINGMFLQK